MVETYEHRGRILTRRTPRQPQQSGECIHRGELVSNEPCTCGSSSFVKVHRCDLHRLCCPSSNADRIKGWEGATLPKNCGGCADFFAKPIELIPNGTIEASQQRPGQRTELEEQVTVIMTAFRRPGCVGRQVASIKQFYPGIRILIGDSGDIQPDVPDGDATIVPLPFDCGISAARNALVKLVQTPYVMLCDDDYIWTANSNIAAAMRIMEHSAASVVGMSWVTERERHHWTMTLSREGATLTGTHIDGPIEETPSGDKFYSTETTENIALCKTELLMVHQWDERLKVHEHWDWYWRLKRHHPDAKVVHAPELSVIHEHNRDRTPEYRQARNRPNYERLAMQLHGLDELKLAPWRDCTTLAANEQSLDKRSILLIGTGHCGSSVAAKMCAAGGWHLPSDADEWNESPLLREYLFRNDPEGFCEAAHAMRSPVVVKDPRIAPILKGRHHRLQNRGWWLVWLQRDMEDVRASYDARGERFADAVEQHKACEQIYRDWQGPKLTVTFEQLEAIAKCWKPERIGARANGAG